MEEGAYDASQYQLEYETVAAQRSMAISLKRIADALTHDPDSQALNIRDLLSSIEMNGRPA